MFESDNDDLYDGDFGEDDDEKPRILINYKLTSISGSVSGLKKPTTKQVRQTKESRDKAKQNAPVPEPKPQHNFVAARQNVY